MRRGECLTGEAPRLRSGGLAVFTEHRSRRPFLCVSAPDVRLTFVPTPSCSGRPHRLPDERPYRTVYYNCIVYVSDKTDGLLGTHYCKWDEDDAFSNVNGTSVLYGDTEPGGGYNHAEVVYARRRYDDPEGAFRKGDLNPTMRDGKELVRGWFFAPTL